MAQENTLHDCTHRGHRVYVRLKLSDGSAHICVQCLTCLSVIRTTEHKNRPYLRLDEVPPGRVIHDFIASGDL